MRELGVLGLELERLREERERDEREVQALKVHEALAGGISAHARPIQTSLLGEFRREA